MTWIHSIHVGVSWAVIIPTVDATIVSSVSFNAFSESATLLSSSSSPNNQNLIASAYHPSPNAIMASLKEQVLEINETLGITDPSLLALEWYVAGTHGGIVRYGRRMPLSQLQGLGKLAPGINWSLPSQISLQTKNYRSLSATTETFKIDHGFIPKLTHHNYAIWRQKVCCILTAQKAYDIVTGVKILRVGHSSALRYAPSRRNGESLNLISIIFTVCNLQAATPPGSASKPTHIVPKYIRSQFFYHTVSRTQRPLTVRLAPLIVVGATHNINNRQDYTLKTTKSLSTNTSSLHILYIWQTSTMLIHPLFHCLFHCLFLLAVIVSVDPRHVDGYKSKKNDKSKPKIKYKLKPKLPKLSNYYNNMNPSLVTPLLLLTTPAYSLDAHLSEVWVKLCKKSPRPAPEPPAPSLAPALKPPAAKQTPDPSPTAQSISL